VRVDERRQGPQSHGCHPLAPGRLLEHALKHQRVDVDEARLEQVEREERDLLVLQAVRRDLAALAEPEEAIGAFQFSITLSPSWISRRSASESR
jgi:hypothetical protein